MQRGRRILLGTLATIGSLGFLGYIPVVDTVVFAQTNNGGAAQGPVNKIQTDKQKADIAAQEAAKKTQSEIAGRLELALKVIYLIMRPLLAIAGAAMDNSLVYGKIFFLDKILWKFWNIMRSFSNFGLGFIFLLAILKPFFTGSGSVGDMVGAIKKVALGALLVNMSRFLVATMIDISTVATVAVGGLPMLAVNKDKNFKKIMFLKPHGITNLDTAATDLASKAKHTVFYSCASDNAPDGNFYLPCGIIDGALMPSGDKANQRDFYKQQFINSRGNTKIKIPSYLPTETTLKESNINNEFCVYGSSLITNAKGGLLSEENLKGKPQLGPVKGTTGGRKGEGVAEMEKKSCTNLGSILEKSKNMSGPLFTLYASILNTSEMSLSTNHKGITDLTIDFMMRTVMSLMLFIPLLAFAVIMIMRVAYLWVVIITAPLIALALTGSLDSFGGSKVKGYIGENGADILSLIFLPVIGTFAISLSVVFLSLLQRTDFIEPVSISKLLGIDEKSDATKPNERCYDLKVTELCISDSRRMAGNNIGNTMSYLFINGFGIALMRAVVFAALKTSKLTEGAVDFVKNTSESLLASAPILPIKGGLSLAGAGKVMESVRDIPRQIQQRQYADQREDTIQGMSTGGQRNEVQQRITTASAPTATAQAAKTAITQGAPRTNSNHSDYTGFYDTLSKSAGNNPQTRTYTNMTEAFSDPAMVNTYTLKEMNDMLTNRNGHTGGTRTRYANTTGAAMKTGLDANTGLVRHTGANNRQYYFNPRTRDYLALNENQDFSSGSLGQTGTPFNNNPQSREERQSVITLIDSLGGVNAISNNADLMPTTLFGSIITRINGITGTSGTLSPGVTANITRDTNNTITNITIPTS